MPKVSASFLDAVHQIVEMLETVGAQQNEAIVRQTIVLRLLQAAGFDIWNPREVVPEETNVGGKRPDFLIRIHSVKAFALEVKGANVVLADAQVAQALTYAMNEGVRWAILTNGRIWVFLDENRKGRPQDREVLRLELTLTNAETFSADLEPLLNASMWREGDFEQVLARVQDSLKERENHQQVLKQRLSEVEIFQKQYKIGSFASAVQLYAELGKISEAERDILLAYEGAPPPNPPTVVAMPDVQATDNEEVASPAIEFQFKVKQAHAKARYDQARGTWTVLAGSTALHRPSPWLNFDQKRQDQLNTGILEPQGDLVVFRQDVDYPSPSAAATAICCKSANGWDVWKDLQGRSAQHYRPTA